jgi:GTP-binding protein Era
MKDVYKSGFVAVVGRPNVGKSTLINSIMGMDLSIVSKKPQTTRRNIRLILTTDEYQMIFIDTPGLHQPKSMLGEHMVHSARGVVREVDIVVLMVEPRGVRVSSADVDILKKLENWDVPVILAINKIDLVRKDEILPLIDMYSKEFEFAGILPISAEKGDGKIELMKELLRLLPEGDMLYPDNMITDMTERELAAEKIREKALRLMNEEIPHGIGVDIERFKYDEDREIYEIEATVYCEKDTHKSIIIGKDGAMLKRIGTSARHDLERILGAKVFLELWVKVKKDWRNKGSMLRTLGYTK